MRRNPPGSISFVLRLDRVDLADTAVMPFFGHFAAKKRRHDLFHFIQTVLTATECQNVGTVLHLLFVDDEPALRSLMAERLGERGFEVVEADSGERAIQFLEQFAFDVAITDLWRR